MHEAYDLYMVDEQEDRVHLHFLLLLPLPLLPLLLRDLLAARPLYLRAVLDVGQPGGEDWYICYLGETKTETEKSR